MKKLLSLLLMLFMVMSMWAESTYKTLTFSAETNSASIGSYTTSWSATIDDFTWNLQNFNNNNNKWNYVKCGRKDNASIGTISTATAIDKAITKVVVTVDAVTVSKINSTTLTVASDADFTTNVQTIELTAYKGEMVYNIETPNTNCYYKLTYDCAAGSSNGLITISKVEYYINEGETPPEPPTPTIIEVANIAELNALEDNTEFKLTGSSVCIWSHGQYTYIQDATAATLIYGTLPEGIIYNITDVIPGGWQGKKVTYNNLPEVKNVSDLAEATTTQNIPATEITLPNIDTNDYYKYVVIKDVLITVETPEPPTPAEHELTHDIIGVNGTTYTAWTNVQGGLSNAIYAGKTAGGNDAIQLRSSKNEDGIVTTTSAGTINSISIIWNDATAATRTVSIYGKNTPYTAATDLYNADNQGDLLGELLIDNNETTVTVEGNYTYWGIRSKSGALWLDAIDVDWNNGSKNLREQTVEGSYTLTDEDGNTITAYPSKLGYMGLPDDLTQRYNVYGVLDYYDGKPQILPLGFEDDEGVITKIDNINNNDIKNIMYYNLLGVSSDKPFDGINIVKIEYKNGKVSVKKIIK